MNPDRGNLFDSTLLGQIRDHFVHVESDPFSGKRIYFENTGGSLTLKEVVKIVAEQTALPDNAGRGNPVSREIERLMLKSKENLMLLLGARSGNIALGESTTSNSFKILEPIIRQIPGNNVVTTNLDHPAVYDATKILCDRYGKEWRVAELCPQSGAVNQEPVLELIDSKTIVLALIHSSNNTGAKNPVGPIIKNARKIKPDLCVLIDGAQYVSHGLVDVEALGVDVYLGSSYKTFSKIGASFMYLSDRISLLPHNRLLGKPENYWELGTREQAGYAAWSVVVDYLYWLGSHFVKTEDRRRRIVAAMEAIELHERALIHRILRGTEKIKGLLEMEHITVYGEISDLTIKEPVIIFNVKGIKSSEVVSKLEKKGIRVTNRISDAYSRHTLQILGIEECVRLSMSHYNSPDEVDVFLKTIKNKEFCRGL